MGYTDYSDIFIFKANNKEQDGNLEELQKK